MRAAALFLLLFILTACAPPQEAPLEPTRAPLPVAAQPSATSIEIASCQQVAAEPTPEAGSSSLFPQPGNRKYDHLRGPDSAAATIIVYSDFSCPVCAPLARILDQLANEHPEDLRLVFRHFPILTAYPNSGMAVRAAESAHAQGKFWEMHDALFENQAVWAEQTDPAALAASLASLAQDIGLDAGQFESDLEKPEIAQIPEQTFSAGLDIGLPGSPLILINGQIYTGPLNYSSLKFIIRLIALGERQFTTCPETVIDPARRYYATLKTEKGDVLIRLYADLAPVTVNSFIFLAQNGWYKNITFHRVIPDFVAQTGDPSGTGSGNPGYFIANETAAGLKFDRAGLVGMANSGPDTNGSQFFITLGPTPHLDGGYTIFGEVVSGLEVLTQLAPRDPLPGQDMPPGDLLFDVIIEER